MSLSESWDYIVITVVVFPEMSVSMHRSIAGNSPYTIDYSKNFHHKVVANNIAYSYWNKQSSYESINDLRTRRQAPHYTLTWVQVETFEKPENCHFKLVFFII